MSEHEDLQHRLLDYHVKVTMRGTEFNPPTIKFEGTIDDSMMDIHPRIDYKGMNESVQILIIMCTVELPNNGHIGSRPFVLYMEVVLLQKQRQF